MRRLDSAVRVFVLVVFVGISGCARDTSHATPGGASATLSVPAVADEWRGSISVAGSTTVQPLAERLASEVMEQHPQVRIAVSGGGSSTGIKSVAAGTVDIGTASRNVERAEHQLYPGLVVHELARDAIAIVAHPGVGVDGLTTEQVRRVFAGEVRNWSELGGTDLALVLVAREEGSGTRLAFEEMVMDRAGMVIAAQAILQPSNGAVRTTIASTPGGVGFLSLGYVDDTVTALAIDGVAPTAEAASNGTYPIVRPLILITLGEPEGLAGAFIDYALGDLGQEVVQAEGYLPAG